MTLLPLVRMLLGTVYFAQSAGFAMPLYEYAQDTRVSVASVGEARTDTTASFSDEASYGRIMCCTDCIMPSRFEEAAVADLPRYSSRATRSPAVPTAAVKCR